jgi:hypothetical protein
MKLSLFFKKTLFVGNIHFAPNFSTYCNVAPSFCYPLSPPFFERPLFVLEISRSDLCSTEVGRSFSLSCPLLPDVDSPASRQFDSLSLSLSVFSLLFNCYHLCKLYSFYVPNTRLKQRRYFSTLWKEFFSCTSSQIGGLHKHKKTRWFNKARRAVFSSQIEKRKLTKTKQTGDLKFKTHFSFCITNMKKRYEAQKELLVANCLNDQNETRFV